MSGAPHGSVVNAGRTDAPAVRPTAAADAPAAGPVTAADAEDFAPAEGTTAAAGTPNSPAPLTSLTSLLGGTIEGGTACTADGTCD